MNVNFILDYPWWFVVFCFATGAIAAAVLYYRNTSADFSPWQKALLSFARFVVVTVVAFLLLAPLLEMQITSRQEPVILIYQDNTGSLTTTRDAAFTRDAWPDMLQDFTTSMGNHFTVNSYLFGEQVRAADTLDFQDRITDMAGIFTSLDVLYSNRNVGAVIIASDGIYNRGQNPVFKASGLMFPIYTIAMGDTVPQRDLLINQLRHNRITYLNNIFPLEITVEARQAAGQRTRVRVFHEGQVVYEQPIVINSDNYFETITAELIAEEVGIKRYRVELDAIEEEITLENNQRDFFIEVIDSRQKVLILSAGPHPDVGALKQALDDNENYEAEVFLIDDFNQDIRDFDILVFHQLPSPRANLARIVSQANQAGIPQLYILGAQSNISAFNRLQTGVQVNIRSAGFTDSRGVPASDFTLFQLTPETMELMPLFPPLQAPFATFSLSPGTQVLAHQRIGTVTTDYPLITLTQSGERKTGMIAGEGLWRWRLNNFARNNNHEAFNELISRMIQFLSVAEDRSFFRITTESFLYENEPAIFDAELYNPSYELVNTPDVEMIITNEEGVEFTYLFGRTGNGYRLNAGVFPVGEYTYLARTQLGAEEHTAEGIFTVSPLNIENINTVANHQLLYQLAENTGGKMFFPYQLDDLLDEIIARDDIRPVLYAQNQYEDIVNLRWIFFLLLFLLTLEWFIRKYTGSY